MAEGKIFLLFYICVKKNSLIFQGMYTKPTESLLRIYFAIYHSNLTISLLRLGQVPSSIAGGGVLQRKKTGRTASEFMCTDLVQNLFFQSPDIGAFSFVIFNPFTCPYLSLVVWRSRV